MPAMQIGLTNKIDIRQEEPMQARSVPVNAEGICENIAKIDWTFSQRLKAHDVEAIHPYPAKFIGEIPRALISNLPVPAGTAVFDPFCGSGTTLVEAQRAGLPAVGIDLNPIACLITRVKTSLLPQEFAEIADRVVREARGITSLPNSNIPNVNHWFKPEVQSAVSALTKTISIEESYPWFDPLRLVLSSILVRVSNQDSDTRYAAVENNIGRDDVFSLFAAAAKKLERTLTSRSWRPTSTQVIEGDTLQVKPNQIGSKIGLVVTSPPYPNAYEYWLYHKYRMWWLGFDPIAVKEKEIGARAHFFKKDPHTAELFVDQMRSTFQLIDSVLVHSGFACFVVGRSKIHGNIIDNAAIIEQLGNEFGFATVTRFDRLIKSNRKSFNLSHANIKKETVLVFKKI
jgi:site-specific DNA-methyltransferase (cytosine-N4-specific)